MESVTPTVKNGGELAKVESGHILLVDDSEEEQVYLSVGLRRQGYRVTVLDSGENVLKVLAESDVDLCLLDVLMPGLSGLEVLRVIREHFNAAELPVIMVTARDEDEDLLRAFDLGANDYLTKPVALRVMYARVRTNMHLKRLLGARDEFFRIASHDLRGPLTVIMGMAHVAQRAARKLNDTDLNEAIDTMSQSARYMRDILNQFVDLQASEVGYMKLSLSLVPLDKLVNDVVSSVSPYARERKGIEVAAELHDGPSVVADPARVRQVLQNLVDNAIKFGKPGTRVTVRTRSSNTGAVVEVVDSGPGLIEADFKKVFKKSEPLSNKPTAGETSTGMGLVLCKNIIELHPGGRIGVHNNPGGGATFWFELSTDRRGDKA